jgi:hypothetical protein
MIALKRYMSKKIPHASRYTTHIENPTGFYHEQGWTIFVNSAKDSADAKWSDRRVKGVHL